MASTASLSPLIEGAAGRRQCDGQQLRTTRRFRRGGQRGAIWCPSGILRVPCVRVLTRNNHGCKSIIACLRVERRAGPLLPALGEPRPQSPPRLGKFDLHPFSTHRPGRRETGVHRAETASTTPARNGPGICRTASASGGVPKNTPPKRAAEGNEGGSTERGGGRSRIHPPFCFPCRPSQMCWRPAAFRLRRPSIQCGRSRLSAAGPRP